MVNLMGLFVGRFWKVADPGRTVLDSTETATSSYVIETLTAFSDFKEPSGFFDNL